MSWTRQLQLQEYIYIYIYEVIVIRLAISQVVGNCDVLRLPMQAIQFELVSFMIDMALPRL